jgi:hypothetical protein
VDCTACPSGQYARPGANQSQCTAVSPYPTPFLFPTQSPTAEPSSFTAIDDYLAGCKITDSCLTTGDLCTTDLTGNCKFAWNSPAQGTTCVKTLASAGQPAYCRDISTGRAPALDLKTVTGNNVMTILTTMIYELSEANDSTGTKKWGAIRAHNIINAAFGLTGMDVLNTDAMLQAAHASDVAIRNKGLQQILVMTQVDAMLQTLQTAVSGAAGRRRLADARRLTGFNVAAAFTTAVADKVVEDDPALATAIAAVTAPPTPAPAPGAPPTPAPAPAAAAFSMTDSSVLTAMATNVMATAEASGAITAAKLTEMTTTGTGGGSSPLAAIAQASVNINEAVQTAVQTAQAATIPPAPAPAPVPGVAPTPAPVTRPAALADLTTSLAQTQVAAATTIAQQVTGLVTGTVSVTDFTTATNGDAIQTAKATAAATIVEDQATAATAAAAACPGGVCPWGVTVYPPAAAPTAATAAATTAAPAEAAECPGGVCPGVAEPTAEPTAAAEDSPTPAPAPPAKVVGSFSLSGVKANSEAAATNAHAKADLAKAIKESLGAESVTIDSLAARSIAPIAPTPSPTPFEATRRRRSATRRLQPSAHRRLVLKTYTLKVKFTATFATKADGDAALLQVTGSSAVATLIQSKLRDSPSSGMWSGVTVDNFEAEEESKSVCDKTTDEKARELCQKAEDSKMAVIGGVVGGVVFLAILAKYWHKSKYAIQTAKATAAAAPDTAVPFAVPVQLELAKSVPESTV